MFIYLVKGILYRNGVAKIKPHVEDKLELSKNGLEIRKDRSDYTFFPMRYGPWLPSPVTILDD